MSNRNHPGLLALILVLLGASLVAGSEPSGVIVSLVGDGVARFAGDGGPAHLASISAPHGMVISATGDLYFADTGNHRVRRVSAESSEIATVVGSGSPGFAGDGGPAPQASLRFPVDVALSPDDALLYIADKGNHRIRQVDLVTGKIVTVAGSDFVGFAGDGGPADRAGLRDPTGIDVESGGDLFIADHYNHRIRRVSIRDGIIQTIAGSGRVGFEGDGGPAIKASLNFPDDVVVGTDGDFYIADHYNNRVRYVDPQGVITTVAGMGAIAYTPGMGELLPLGPPGAALGDGGSATLATLHGPVSIDLDGCGSVYVADSGNNRIRRIETDGRIVTVAGGSRRGYSGDGGPALGASMYWPRGLAVGVDGVLFIADTQNNRIRVVEPPIPGRDGIGRRTPGPCTD